MTDTDRILSAIQDVKADVAGLDRRLASVEQRLGAVEHRLGAVESRLGAVEHAVHDISAKLLAPTERPHSSGSTTGPMPVVPMAAKGE